MMIIIPFIIEYNMNELDNLRNQIVILSNGKRVANFSSPHEFKFVDGTILPAVSNEDAEKYKVDFIETEINHIS
jgi:hypothetical protein